MPPAVHILAVGVPERWPDPLPALLASGTLLLHTAADPYEATLKLRAGTFAAILVDPQRLSRHELTQMLAFKRHVALPIWSLPTSSRTALINDLGILAWEDAARALSPLHAYTPDVLQGNSGEIRTVSPPPVSDPVAAHQTPRIHPPPVAPPTRMTTADNKTSSDPMERTEIPVASEVAARYYEAETTPLLTPQELQALLGPAEQGPPSDRGGSLSAVPEISPQNPAIPPLPAMPRHIAPGGLMVVGPQAAGVSRRITALANCQVVNADSLLEAALMSGQATGLILVDAGLETDQLEAGVRSLRRINPGVQIVLLAEPVDEVPCRRALDWGADGYEIIPLTPGDVVRLAALTRGTRRAMSATTESARTAGATTAATDAPATDLPAIPLMRQTALLEEILEGGGLKPDFATRAAEIVARLLDLPGTVTFAGQAPDAAPGEIHRAVAFADQEPFGTLTWRPASSPVPPTPAQTGLLAQGAHWLASMLATAQRFEQLRLMAITDELSGAYNRRYFMKYMTALLERSRENHSRITLLLFDIDDFKRYNDTFGHASGDAIIRELIKLLRACTRPKDLVARIGGDEFAAVYWDNEPRRQPNSDHPKEILAATERFREAIRSHKWPETCNIRGTISISGGLASFPYDAETLESLLSKADEALLKAKAAGKNVIVLHNHAEAAVG